MRYEVRDIDQTAEIAALKAERDRLRAALEAITKLDEKTYKDCYAAPTIARRALDQTKNAD
jgi:hypothetical protein